MNPPDLWVQLDPEVRQNCVAHNMTKWMCFEMQCPFCHILSKALGKTSLREKEAIIRFKVHHRRSQMMPQRRG